MITATPQIIIQTRTSTPTPFPTMTASPTSRPSATPTITPTATPWVLLQQPVINRSNIAALSLITRFAPDDAAAPSPAGFAFSPDGQTLAYTHSGKVILWNFPSGQTIQTLERPDTLLPDQSALAFHPNGKQLAQITQAQQVTLWSVETGTIFRTLDLVEPGLSLLQLAFSPPNIYPVRLVGLASTPAGAKLIFWDPLSGEKIAEDLIGSQAPGLFRISPTGLWVIHAAPEGVLRFWNLQTGDFISQQYIYACTDTLNGISFTPNGALIALQCSANGAPSDDLSVLSRFYLYQPNYFRPDNIHLLLTMQGHQPENGQMTFNRDGGMLASIGGNDADQVFIWGLYEREPTRTIDSLHQEIKQVEFNQDGRLLAVQYADGTLEVWAIQTQPLSDRSGVDKVDSLSIPGLISTEAG